MDAANARAHDGDRWLACHHEVLTTRNDPCRSGATTLNGSATRQLQRRSFAGQLLGQLGEAEIGAERVNSMETQRQRSSPARTACRPVPRLDCGRHDLQEGYHVAPIE